MCLPVVLLIGPSNSGENDFSNIFLQLCCLLNKNFGRITNIFFLIVQHNPNLQKHRSRISFNSYKLLAIPKNFHSEHRNLNTNEKIFKIYNFEL